MVERGREQGGRGKDAAEEEEQDDALSDRRLEAVDDEEEGKETRAVDAADPTPDETGLKFRPALLSLPLNLSPDPFSVLASQSC